MFARRVMQARNLIAKRRVGDAASYARSTTALPVRNGNRRQRLEIASLSCLGKRYSATLATKSTACFRSAVDRPQRLGRTRVGDADGSVNNFWDCFVFDA
jgi:hypothetical protein